MEVTLRPMDYDGIKDFEMLTKWFMDESIRHLFTVDFNKGPTVPLSPQDLREVKMQNKSTHSFMVEVDGEIAGDCSVDTAFDMLMGPKTGTGWLGICIGEAKYRGKGVGYKAMVELEEICRKMGLFRLELGVFAYNEKAIDFYKKLGYQHFETVKDFTYYQGTWHDDYRMEKTL